MLCLLGALGVLGNELPDNPKIDTSSFSSSERVGKEYITCPFLLLEREAGTGVDIWCLTGRGRGGIKPLFLFLSPVKSMPGFGIKLAFTETFRQVNLQNPYRAKVMNHCPFFAVV